MWAHETSMKVESYCDAGVFMEERQRVFRTAWHYVCAADRLRSTGDYVTDALDDVQVLVANSGTGEVKAFVNACLHRCHEVTRGEGNERSWRCRYHGWTYALDGALRHSPGWKPHVGDDNLRLQPLPVGIWGPLVFVCPSQPRVPFDEWFEPIGKSIRDAGLDPDILRYETRDPWSFRANWKIGVENFLECYHCPATHPDLSRHIDVRLGAVRFTPHRWVSTQVAQPRRHSENLFAPYVPTREASYHFLWPATTITVNPGPPSLLLNAWRPVGPELTNGFEDSFFGSEVDERHKAATIAYSSRIGNEDTALVESVQRGVRSLPASNNMRLLNGEECLIAHFRELVEEAMSDKR
jgi:choline monooxygenase